MAMTQDPSRSGFWAVALLLAACGGNDESSSGLSGGATSGGSGGTSTGGTRAGGASSGGTVSGGTASGGMVSGGTSSGGTSTGGTSSGGTRTGGTSSGGTRTGGTGGTPTGGAPAAVLHVQGNRVLDTCDRRFVARGMEQITATAFSSDGTLAGIVREIAATNSNAVRLLPVISEVTAANLEQMLTAFAAERIVVYLSPGDTTWFGRSEVRTVLLRHEKGIIVDAFQEPDYWDVPRWVREAQAAIALVRGYGYSCPLTVLADGYGRNLPAALEHGAEIVAADPLGNTIVGWQAYWGVSGWYQREYGMSLTQGVAAAAARPFAMQIGIDLYADPSDQMDYSSVMAACQTHSIGWLWWDWWNQWDGMGNNASRDGTAAHLTEVGEIVVHTDPNSIQRTATKACFR